MTRNEKIYYESLLISDKLNNKNEAEKYLKELQNRNEEDILHNKSKISFNINNTYIKYKWTTGLSIFYILLTVLIFTIGMSENKNLHNSIKQLQETTNKIYKQLRSTEIKNEFYKDSSLVYNEINTFGIIFIIIGILIYIILNLYCIFEILRNEFNKDNEKLIWLIAIIFIPITFMIFLDLKIKLLKY